MAKKSITRVYEGLATGDVSWDELTNIFDAIWGREARSLPFYPEVIGGVKAEWADGVGVKHEAEKLEEVAEAYTRHETALIAFGGHLEGSPDAEFAFVPRSGSARIRVTAADAEAVGRVITTVQDLFPMVPQYVFVSYATADFELAQFLAGLLERRLASPATVFVAKRDIPPGRDPRKTMLEEQLRRASALVALCSFDSKQSGWLWWEASSVWTRDQLVVPLFVGIGASEFDGPMTLVLQGRSVFEPADLAEALQAVADQVSSPGSVTPLSSEELAQLKTFEGAYQASRRRRDPVREQRLKELLNLVLELKDTAFEAHDRGDRWSSKMANAESKMDTVLKQLADEAFPPQVAEYARAGHPNQVMSMWQQVHAMVQKVLLEGPS